MPALIPTCQEHGGVRVPGVRTSLTPALHYWYLQRGDRAAVVRAALSTMPNFAAADDNRRIQRISLRTTAEERALISRAALVSTGGDLTRFMMNASLEAARRAIESFETTELAETNRRAFYELVLIDPPKANEALRSLARNPVPEGFELDE